MACKIMWLNKLSSLFSRFNSNLLMVRLVDRDSKKIIGYKDSEY